MATHLNRRQFLRQAAVVGTSAAAFGTFAVRAHARPRRANDKLNIACIGVGGRGGNNLKAMAGEDIVRVGGRRGEARQTTKATEGENIVALCDVDQNRLEAAAKQFPQARKYADFRKLLEQEKDLDAAVVSTPDHCHAAASVMAMNLGLHVYCEKPLTHTVYEARVMTETAARRKVVTQMGTGHQSTQSFVRTVELVQAGAIGAVREVHTWTNRPIWPQGMDRLPGEDPVPPQLNWDLWIGPAPMRPYKDKYTSGPLKGKQVYHPFVWRGWWDFGSGALGDMSPHIMNVAFRALKLGAPISVEAECSGMKPEAFPSWSIIRYEFPARGNLPPVKLIWYDGGKLPPRELFEDGENPQGGALFIGDKGKILDSGPVLLPKKAFADYRGPEPSLPRPPEVHQDWLQAIKNGTQPACDFSYSGPMTEAYLLGNVALRVGQKIQWDASAFQVTNCPEANQYLKMEYRKGWEL